MDRRTFIKWISLAALASSLPVALSACLKPKKESDLSELNPKSVKSTPRADGFWVVGQLADLAESGSFRYHNAQGDAVLVVGAVDISSEIRAFSPACTHQGCSVTWQMNDKNIFCACHGSRFQSDGTVAKGPAQSKLSQYATKVEGDSILVKLT